MSEYGHDYADGVLDDMIVDLQATLRGLRVVADAARQRGEGAVAAGIDYAVDTIEKGVDAYL